jgi:hypothetical protein
MHADALTLYSGQQLVGSLVELKCSGWSAYDSKQRFLGEFPNRTAAEHAIDGIAPREGGYLIAPPRMTARLVLSKRNQRRRS